MHRSRSSRNVHKAGSVYIIFSKGCGFMSDRRICFIGNVDSGKSTACGKMLADLKSLGSSVTMPRPNIDKRREYANMIGKQSFQYAFLMDCERSENERGITMRGSLGTIDHKYMVFDCPGHKDFIKNACRIIGCCDAAVLVVDAGYANNEEYFFDQFNSPAKDSYGCGPREGGAVVAAKQIKGFGIKNVVVLVNKLQRCENPKVSLFIVCLGIH